MSDQCGYERDGQYEVRALDATCRDLRTDVDGLLNEVVRLRDEVRDLKRFFQTLRSRVDSNEMAPVS